MNSNNLEKEKELQKKGVEIAKKLFERYYPPTWGYSEEEREITSSNLRNFLEAAREATEIGSFDIFRLKAAYIARNTESGDPLYRFVSNLIREIDSGAQSEEEKLKLAVYTLTACIYVYTAIDKGLRGIIYPRRR